ncbi:MAG: hypothetical protein E7373_04295 [Clostridiales bacterium]|nr:hypothetical protein [Clostridiales bacterium]
MKKVLKILLSAVLVLSFVFGATACVNPNNGGTTKSGLSYKKVDGGIYEIFKYNDDGKEEIEIKIDNVTEGIRIKKDAFAGNTNLKRIIVTSAVTEIQAGAFANMNSLEALALPFVGRYANADVKFKETGSATASQKKAIDAERTIAHLFGNEDYANGVEQTINYGAGTAVCYMPKTLKRVVVNAESTYSIPWGAFNGANHLEVIALLGDIDAIGENAFANTTISELEIPASVKTIHKEAFKSSLIKNVKFADGAKVDLLDSAFFGCSLLSFVGKGDAVENTIDLSLFNTIGENAFDSQNAVAESRVKTYSVQNAGDFNLELIFGDTKVN